MNRLLAKLPRSSSGSRELSASSRAAAFPAAIFEVSITGAGPDLAEASFAPVSAFICSGGASSGDFILLARAVRFGDFELSRGVSHCHKKQRMSRSEPGWHIRIDQAAYSPSATCLGSDKIRGWLYAQVNWRPACVAISEELDRGGRKRGAASPQYQTLRQYQFHQSTVADPWAFPRLSWLRQSPPH